MFTSFRRPFSPSSLSLSLSHIFSFLFFLFALFKKFLQITHIIEKRNVNRGGGGERERERRDLYTS